MIKTGIFNGDYIIVRKQNYADNGDVVVALLEEEATVKRFFRDNGKIRLQPENDAFEAILLDTVTILGKVVGLFRKM